MSQDSRPFVRLTGSVDFRDRSLSLTSASALHPATYPPFDSLLVAGWQYVEIDSAVSRPSRLQPDVNWVSFQGTHRLNLPTWTAIETPISAPPTDQVRRLTAGENLYANNTTTTLPPAQSDAVAGNQALFTADRAELEAALGAQPDPKLTNFSFDPRTDTVSASFTYAHPALENLNDYDAFAWQVGQNVSGTFWFPELVQNTQTVLGKGVWLPHLHLQVNKVSYTCAPSVEIAMAATGVSRRDWVAACRG